MEVAKYISRLGPTFFHGLKNIMMNGMFSHFSGAGLIQKLLMLTSYSIGDMQADIVVEDG